MTNLLQRLRERKLVQWALAYLAGAWVLLQVVGLIGQQFDWPAGLLRGITVAAGIGFFIALVLAWYHGERGVQRVSGAELLLLAVLLAIGGGLLWRFSVAPRAGVAAAETARPIAEPAASPGAASAAGADPRSIAVLPFENLSGDKDNEYFASGMQDMILTKLAAIGQLKVISRTSTEKYASHPDNLKTIAAQLGVASILEGSVQKSGSSVLINVQLIDANSDAHLWADAYPRTLENIFGVEGEVAQKVADALKAKLTTAESASVASVPTQNAAAYEAFLRAEYLAEQARQTWQLSTYLAADADYRRAIELDPGFALAHAKLALCELSRHWFGKNLDAAEMSAVKASIDRALALAPELPDAHLALAFYHYWGFRQYPAATVEFERVGQLSPNAVDALGGLGFVARRDSRIAQSRDYFQKAVALSPRDPRLLGESAWTYVLLRRYADADRQLRQALAIAPADSNAIDAFVRTRLFGFGDISGAADALRNPPDWRIVGSNTIGGDVVNLINTRALPAFFARHFDDALRAWDAAPLDTAYERRSGRVARAAIRIIAGDASSAQAECRALEPELAAELARAPDALDLLQQMSWMQVCLGDNAQALATAQKAADALPIGKDSYFGAYQVAGIAQIATHAGAPDKALQVIRQLLAMPAGAVISVTRLRLDPVWDPLRRDPRFQTLIEQADAAQLDEATP